MKMVIIFSWLIIIKPHENLKVTQHKYLQDTIGNQITVDCIYEHCSQFRTNFEFVSVVMNKLHRISSGNVGIE